MSAPITPDPNIHNLSPSQQAQQIQVQIQQIEQLVQHLIQTIIQAVLSLISGGLLGGGGPLGAILNLIPGASIFTNVFQNFFSMFGLGGSGINGLTGSTGSFNPTSLLTGWINDLISPLGLLLGSNDPLNAGNLFGLIPTNLLNILPIGNIGNVSQEFLDNPGFTGSGSLVTGVGTNWSFDATTGRTNPGSALYVANGHTSSIFSNPIQVAQGQAMTLSVYAQWSALSATGSPIQLNVAKYLDGALVGYEAVNSIASPGASASWTQLSGTYTVPSGVDRIRVKLTVGSTATSGSVWFDDASTTKTGLLSNNWMTGLGGLGTIGGDLQNVVDGFLNGILGGSSTGNPVSSILSTAESLMGMLFDGVSGNSFGTSSGKSLLDVFNIFSGFFGGSGIFGSLLNSLFDGINGSTGTTGTTVGGVLGIFQSLMNNLFDGMNGTSGSSGKGLLDVFGIFQGVNNNLFGGITGQSTSNQSATQAQMGQAVANQASTVIGTAALLAQAMTGISGGNRDADDFERTSSTDLGANWDIQHTGTITVSTSDGHDAVFSAGFLASGEATCRKTDVQAATDIHSVSLVLQSTPASLGDNGYNDLWCRMSNFSSFATRTGIRARYGGDGSLVLSWFNSGTETVLNSGTASIKAAAGSTISLEAGQGSDPHHYVIKMNGTPIMDFPDTGSHSSTGTGFRYRGFGGKSESFLVNFMPGSINQYTAAG